MFLTRHEQDRLLIHVAADVAWRRRERGLRLNHPEATAVITAFLLEAARDGRTVGELMEAGRQVLTREDVLEARRFDDHDATIVIERFGGTFDVANATYHEATPEEWQALLR